MKITSLLKRKNSDAYHTRPVTIGFLGDSVTNGCFEVPPALTDDGIKGYDVVFDPENGYPAKVRRILTMLYPEAQINIINAGISGSSAPNGLERMDRDLLPYRPDLTVVCFGLNDCCEGEAGLQKYSDALIAIIKKLQEAGSEVIVMTPQPICTRVHTQLKGDELRIFAHTLVDIFESGVFEKYMQTARDAAESCNVPLCDCYAKWKKLHEGGVDITSLLSNYLNHPTRDMHWLFATSLVEAMFN